MRKLSTMTAVAALCVAFTAHAHADTHKYAAAKIQIDAPDGWKASEADGNLTLASPDGVAMIIVGVIAVLLFGSRLPEVARSLGKSFVEFKRGIHGLESEVNDAIYQSPSSSSSSSESTSYDDAMHEPVEPDAPKFEPPTSDASMTESEPVDSTPEDGTSPDSAPADVASADASDTTAGADPNAVEKTI